MPEYFSEYFFNKKKEKVNQKVESLVGISTHEEFQYLDVQGPEEPHRTFKLSQPQARHELSRLDSPFKLDLYYDSVNGVEYFMFHNTTRPDQVVF